MANYIIQLTQVNSDFSEILGKFNTKDEALTFAEEFRKTTDYITVSKLVEACNKAADKEWQYLHDLEKTDKEKWFEEYMSRDTLYSLDNSDFENETMELELFVEDEDADEWETLEEYILEPDDLTEHKKFIEFLKRYGVNLNELYSQRSGKF